MTTIPPTRSLIRPTTDPTLLMMTAVPVMSRSIMIPVVLILRMIPPVCLRRILSRKKLFIKSPIFYEEKATDMSCFMSAAFFFTEERFRQKIYKNFSSIYCQLKSCPKNFSRLPAKHHSSKKGFRIIVHRINIFINLKV